MDNTAKAIVLFALLAGPVVCHAEDSNVDPSMSCFASLESKPELKALKGRIALSDVRKQTIEMLANGKKPTKSEKAAISVWVTSVEQCVADGSSWRQQANPPQANALFVQYFADLKSLAADLYSGKISYGNFAKGRASFGAKLISDLTDVNQKVMAQRKAQEDELRAQQERRDQQAREDQRRQQEFAAQQQQQQEMIKQQRIAQQRQAALAQQQLQQQQQAQYQQQMQQNYQQQMQSNDEWLRSTTSALRSPTTTNTDCTRDYNGNIHCTSR